MSTVAFHQCCCSGRSCMCSEVYKLPSDDCLPSVHPNTQRITPIADVVAVYLKVCAEKLLSRSSDRTLQGTAASHYRMRASGQACSLLIKRESHANTQPTRISHTHTHTRTQRGLASWWRAAVSGRMLAGLENISFSSQTD